MLCVRRLRRVLFWLAGFIFVVAFQLRAETVYCWRDQDGRAVYSNISHPSGVDVIKEFAGAISKPVQVPESSKEDNPTPEGPVGNTEAGAGVETVSGPGKEFLKGRIARREASVRGIENLIQAHPDDLSLRKHLQKKKQSIQEDQVRLKLLAD